MLNALIANIQDAIVLLDETGHVIYESPSAASLLGVPSNDVLKAFGMSRIHPDDRGAVVESFERTRAVPGAVFRASYRFQRGDGEWRHLEALARNLLHERELNGVLITFRDVTDRIRAVEDAEKASAARDEFLSRMSHELRTPLHAILGWAQLLKQEDSTEVRDAAEHILAAGAHLFHLVNDALDLAAVQEGRIPIEIRPVSLAAVIEEAIELALPLATRSQIRIRETTRPSPGITALVDPIRLRQVLLNLLTNAVKYNHPGGLVEVGLAPSGESRWRIHIRDTGPGIPQSKFDRLFERFDRLDAEGTGIAGSGLGLAISKRLIELMGGGIGVESTPGQGSTFWIDVRACSEVRLPTGAGTPEPALLAEQLVS